MGYLTLLLGGARSGKSSHAQRMSEAHGGRVTYIATATVLDEEMVARVAAHQHDRPQEWRTLELPYGVSPEHYPELSEADVILLDCLTFLVTNLLMRESPDEDHPDEARASEAVNTAIDELLSTIKHSRADWFIVSNEVGLGLVPPYPLGRIYRDLLGRANQRLAAQADEVYWMVAGIPVPIHNFRT
jgi:adenosylcobinamide kinase / adenosylcobinamide-phosphate guanylyltransferase